MGCASIELRRRSKMAQFINQTLSPQMSPFNQMGKPIPATARSEGYSHCKDMGLNSARAMECVNGVSEQLQRDKPYEAMETGMKFLDLTGTYRLFAVLLCGAAQETKKPKKKSSKKRKKR